LVNENILVIAPTYNEISNIENFLIQVTQLDVTILIIDDNSPDGTHKVVKKFAETNPNVNLIVRNKKKGLGSAYRDGFDWFLKKQYSHCIEMDVDFSHRVVDLEKLIKEIDIYDLVIGSRYINGGGSKGWDVRRKFISNFANKFAGFLLRSKIKDLTSGFRIFSKNALEIINFKEIKTNGYGFQIEMAYLAEINNLKIKEIPIIFEERRLGESKMSYWIVLEAVFLIFKLVFTKQKV